MSLSARIERLALPEGVRGFVLALAEVDPEGCGRLLDDRAANPGFALAYWAPRMCAGTLSSGQQALMAVPALIRAPLPRPAALRMAGRLGVSPETTETLVARGLWVHTAGVGYGLHPLAASFASDPETVGDGRAVLRALLDADAVDELPPEALGEVAGLVLGYADQDTLADAVPRVIDALQLADRMEDALPFAHAALGRLDDVQQSRVLHALGEALELDDRSDEALTHYGMAAALAPPGPLLAACRQAMGDLHVERAEGELAGRALAEAHGAWVQCEEWGAACDVALTLGSLAIVAGHASTAVQWLQEAIRLGGLAGSSDRVVGAHELLAEAERSRGNPHLAEDLQREADRLRLLSDQGTDPRP